ncbi:MAG TPA: hypothetical protein DGG95_09465, partial [Cytophagales bacterium]|nr:hypothetical protein [Cytophagales bacterium]
LEVVEINKQNHTIGRIALYFYTKFYDFRIDNKKAFLVNDSGEIRSYKIIVPFTEDNRMDTLNNFRIKKINGKWKIDVIPDEMRGN